MTVAPNIHAVPGASDRNYPVNNSRVGKAELRISPPLGIRLTQ